MRAIALSTAVMLTASIFNTGCNKETERPRNASNDARTSSADPSQTATNEATGKHDHATEHADDATGKSLNLDGLSFTLPDGWRVGDIGAGPFPPVAVFDLPPSDGGTGGGQLRITHYPAMKGKDDMNLMRWIGQVSKDDGSSYSLDEAQLSVKESGHIRIKSIDLSGNVKATMRSTPEPNARMIAAIVDHPKGPHFIVATGPKAVIEYWAPSINTFLASAKTE